MSKVWLTPYHNSCGDKIMKGTLLVLFFGMLLFAMCVFEAKASGTVVVLPNHTGWRDALGYYRVSGEVENAGDGAVKDVWITATFYDAGGNMIGTANEHAYLKVLLPGRKSPFEVLLTTAAASQVHHYSLSVTATDTDPIPEGLEILSSNSYIESISGNLVVSGIIKNVASETAHTVKVIAAFYNESGYVVATVCSYLGSQDLGPNETTSFNVMLDWNTYRVGLVSTYSLTAESLEYALVPEFPSIMVLSAFLVASLLTAAYTKKI
ncbi:MAG: FxLYD domain-containing protein [Candidatus Bathyarchaeia archaeon]